MIHNFSDHAANERTFLAWVRTAIARADLALAALMALLGIALVLYLSQALLTGLAR